MQVNGNGNIYTRHDKVITDRRIFLYSDALQMICYAMSHDTRKSARMVHFVHRYSVISTYINVSLQNKYMCVHCKIELNIDLKCYCNVFYVQSEFFSPFLVFKFKSSRPNLL